MVAEEQTEQKSLVMVDGFIKTPGILPVLELVRKSADTDKHVLLMGESGTGKDVIAQTIHINSRRRANPYIPVNCGAIVESLLERELFGHEKGAFTGADRYRPGYFESANGGTLLLDEIESATPGLQVKFLRAIERGKIFPVGAAIPKQVDVRIIAASKQDLQSFVEHGSFRADLYYRLNVLSITIPPLRQRPEDIALLVQYFLKLENERSRKQKSVDEQALEFLTDYPWPGNVRELESVIQRVYLYSDNNMLEKADFVRHGNLNNNIVQHIQEHTDSKFCVAQVAKAFAADGVPLREFRERVTKQCLIELLKRYHGSVRRVAETAGFRRAHIYKILCQYGIDFKPYKSK